ncbi:MAG: endonuclease/exonuclease/phosphatase family protein [Clostridia bacterium]|nr:endonuclease/exonuclease/phosphatase family protein [Clostridia bacterium]
MKIMTFNTQHCVNYLKQCIDYELIARTISDTGADICGLNEMFSGKAGDTYPNQTKILSELTGMKSYYFAEAAYFAPDGGYGNGLLSKYKILEAETVKIPDPCPKRYNGYYETRCVLKAKIEGGYTVLVCHFGLNPDEHENAVKTILENITDEKCILMGDFNVTPENSVLDPIRERMSDTSLGFCENTPSWPSDAPRVKIDYVFVSRDLCVEYAEVSSVITSDHRAHIAIINDKENTY